MTEWTSGLRVGGQWRVTAHRADGNDFPASGAFLEIDVPRKIVQTREYEWEHPTLGRHETTVTYRFEPVATGTRVTVRHDGFRRQPDAAEEHARRADP